MDAWPGDYSKPPAGVRDVLYARIAGWLAWMSTRPAILLIRGTADIASEFQEIQGTLSETTHRGSWRSLTPAVRPALIVGIGLAVFQQVTGSTRSSTTRRPLSSLRVFHRFGRNSRYGGDRCRKRHMTGLHVAGRPCRAEATLLTGTAGMVVSLGILGLAFEMRRRRFPDRCHHANGV